MQHLLGQHIARVSGKGLVGASSASTSSEKANNLRCIPSKMVSLVLTPQKGGGGGGGVGGPRDSPMLHLQEQLILKAESSPRALTHPLLRAPLSLQPESCIWRSR